MTNYKLEVSSWKNVTFRHTVRFSIADLGYDQDDWDEMTDGERETIIEEYIQETVLPKYVQYGWSEEP